MRWTIRTSAQICAASLVAGCALFRGPLVLSVGRGDSVSRVVDRHAEEVREHIPDEEQWADLSPDELTRKLLEKNSASLVFGVNPGNRIAIYDDGRLEIRAGRGEAPQAAITAEKVKRAAESLLEEMPEDVHEHITNIAEQGGVIMRAYSLSQDRRTLTVGDETYTASEGIQFLPRRGHFHVLGKSEAYDFNIPVWPVEGLPFSFPSNPYFFVSQGNTVELKSDAEATLARLLAEGEINTADGKYHVTRKFGFGPWRNLVRMAESEDTPAMRKRLATEIEITLLSRDLDINTDSFARGIAKMKTRINRAWQALESEMSGQELTFVIAHNAALDMGGKLLYVGDQLLSTGEGLRFDLCKSRIHVIGDPALGVDVAIEPPKPSQKLEAFSNAFVKMTDGHVVMRQLDPDILKALKEGQIVAREHGYHITEKFHEDVHIELLAAATGTSIDSKLREAIRKMLDDATAYALPISTPDSLMKALRKLRRRFDYYVSNLRRHRQRRSKR